MKTYNITPDMVLAAEAMIANDMDYWPHGLIDYPATDETDYCLYSYEDGIWLVDTKSTCLMNDAVQLVKVMSNSKENIMDDKTIAAAEKARLNDLIHGSIIDLALMMDTDQYHEEIEATRIDIAAYKAALAKYN